MTSQSNQNEDILLSLLPTQRADVAIPTSSPLQHRVNSSSTSVDDDHNPVSSSQQSSRASSISAASSRAHTQTDRLVQRVPRVIGTLFRSFVQRLRSATEDRLKRSRFYGWRMGVLFGSCMSAFVLCCNLIVVVIGSRAHFGFQDGIANVRYGKAESISRWSTFFHILINAGSTILLASSNYTMQVLCSPTRHDIDTAHSNGRWVDIGLLSFRNLKVIPRKRVALVLLLAFSSIPLHLFYNAAVFQIATYNEYNITLIEHGSEEFGSVLKISDYGVETGQTIQFQMLRNDRWKQAYDTKLVSEYSDLFLSIDRVAFDTSNLRYLPEFINISDYLPSDPAKGSQELIQALTYESTEWISFYNFPSNASVGSPIDSMRVNHAFAKKSTPQSKIQVSLHFILIVIAFNSLKLFIMLWVLFTDRRDYIVTLGDASATFLKHPDPVTRDKCTYGKEEMLYCLGHVPYHPKREDELLEEYFSIRLSGKWLPQRRHYLTFISRDRQVFFVLLFCLIVSATILTPIFGFTRGQATANRSWGTSSSDILNSNSGILFNAWIVNLPQLVLSLCYLALNTICTSMASAKEWNDLGEKRKGLRVTRPEGSQRSTYFLQLPYKWATPLLFTSGILHWLLSQSFFLVRLDLVNRENVIVEEASQSACGFSKMSLLIFFIVALLLVCAIGRIGLQHLEQKMPFAASCSLVISAACHPPEQDVDAQVKEVKWGVVEEQTQQGYAHCSITAMPTKKRALVEGMLYR